MRVGTIALAVFAIGCGDERPERARAVELARAHQGDVLAFERWAARVAASDTTYRDRAALEEAAFAPIRGEAAIAAAWIERRGPDPSVLAHPRGADVPADLAWRSARVEGMGEVEVAERDRREWIRTTRDAPGGARLVVTIAFVADPR